MTPGSSNAVGDLHFPKNVGEAIHVIEKIVVEPKQTNAKNRKRGKVFVASTHRLLLRLDIWNTRQLERPVVQHRILSRQQSFGTIVHLSRRTIHHRLVVTHMLSRWPMSCSQATFECVLLADQVGLSRFGDRQETGVASESWSVALGREVVMGCARVPYTKILASVQGCASGRPVDSQTIKSPGSASTLTHSQPWSFNHFMPRSVYPYHSGVHAGILSSSFISL